MIVLIGLDSTLDEEYYDCMLHERVNDLFPGDKSTSERALLHAMIDLGHVTNWSCQWEHCVLPGIPVGPRKRGKNRDSVTFDHTIARVDGGHDHWSNLRLMHHTCNMRKSHAFGEATRKKIGDSSRKLWEDPEYRSLMTDGMRAHWADPEYKERTSARIREGKRTPEGQQRSSESMKKAWANPEKKAKRVANYPRGEAWHAARNRDK